MYRLIKNRYVFFGVFFLAVTSCNSPKKGDLIGAPSKRWFSERPYGMTLIPQGVYIMGNTSEDIQYTHDAPAKTISMSAFYMDDTEITNSEYRQFVYWVRDSIVRTHLADIAQEQDLKRRDKNSVGMYAYKYTDTILLNTYQKYMFQTYPDIFGKRLNWDIPLVWEESQYIDVNYATAIDSMYKPLSYEENARLINIDKLKFSYTWFDTEASARSTTRDRKSFIRKETTKVYPDTLVWISDFSYAYNDPRHNEYFYHESYSNYPVVGVNWHQAKAFCAWRTLYKKMYQQIQGDVYGTNFRLPSEIEWEYAAAGGIDRAKYPWGAPYTLNDKGCYLANFKPLRGDYSVDGAIYTAEMKLYQPNNYGLYDMAGNVSEWTGTTYEKETYTFESDLNPNITRAEHQRKVIRGGSWKDVAYYLRVNTRDYEYADSSHSYIGFRTIQSYLGDDQLIDNIGD